MENNKYSSQYALVKQPLESTKIYSLFDARNKESGQIWLAKVFHHEPIVQLDMQDHIEYNQQVLQNLKEKEHIIYVSQIFLKGSDTYLIQEKYDIKLSQHIDKMGSLPAKDVENILRHVFQGVCDIYEERYVHRNIRAEHIVRVGGEQEVWKIQTLVLDNKEYPIDSPFTWKRGTASPQDLNQREQIDQDQYDAQVVWNFGYLALEMLMGTYLMSRIQKQTQVSWTRIKELTSECPNLFQLINGCFRHKYKDRIGLKKFFGLKIFQQVLRPGIGEYFMTASKIFKAKTISSIQQSINMKSRNMKSASKSVKKEPTGHDYFQKIEEVSEHLYDQTQRDATRFCFLLQATTYLPLIKCSSEIQGKMPEIRGVLDLFYTKLAQKFQERTRKGKRAAGLSELKKKCDSKIQQHSRVIKRINETENSLVQKFNLVLNKDYSHQELLSIFNKLNGYAYSRMQQQCENSEEEQKLKGLAFFGLLAYLVNLDDWSQLDNLKGSTHNQHLEHFQKTEAQVVLPRSQKLLKQYFQID